MTQKLLTEIDRAFIGAQRVARLATSDTDGQPHALPICYVVPSDTLYFSIDQKPKSGDPRRLKRLRNIAKNPKTAVIIDRYDDDWDLLGWVMLSGLAEIIDGGSEHHDAQNALVEKYPPYRNMQLAHLPVVAIRLKRVVRWGNLSVSIAG